MWDLPAKSDIYLRAVGPLVPAASPLEGDGVLRLAGTTTAFTALEVIASCYGDRIANRVIPFPEISGFITQLPDSQRAVAQHQLTALQAPRAPMALAQRPLSFDQGPLIMGVVNVTPDSFSDGGEHLDPEEAIAHGHALAAAGAAILDIGGESTRPGAKPVWEEEEKRRVLPVIEGLKHLGVPISIDSRRAGVMAAALEAGASIINDVSALTYDDDAIAVVRDSGAPVMLMHHVGTPETMQADPSYQDVALDVFDWLRDRVAFCIGQGIAEDRIFLDPGIGFGKTVRHNLELINALSLFHALGRPLVLGLSRKRFIGAVTGAEEPRERVPGSLAGALVGIQQGIQIIRVHDVAQTRQLTKLWQGLVDTAVTGGMAKAAALDARRETQ